MAVDKNVFSNGAVFDFSSTAAQDVETFATAGNVLRPVLVKIGILEETSIKSQIRVRGKDSGVLIWAMDTRARDEGSIRVGDFFSLKSQGTPTYIGPRLNAAESIEVATGGGSDVVTNLIAFVAVDGIVQRDSLT